MKPSEAEIQGGIGFGGRLFNDIESYPSGYHEDMNIQSTDLDYGEYVRDHKEDNYNIQKAKKYAEKMEREKIAQKVADKVIAEQKKRTGWEPGPAAGPLLGAQAYDKWGNTTRGEFFSNPLSTAGITAGGIVLNWNIINVILLIILIIIMVQILRELRKLNRKRGKNIEVIEEVETT